MHGPSGRLNKTEVVKVKSEIAVSILEHLLPMARHTRPKGTGVLPRRSMPMLPTEVLEETADQIAVENIPMHQQATLGQEVEKTTFAQKMDPALPPDIEAVKRVRCLFEKTS